MPRHKLSLTWLEIFRLAAQSGSVRSVAAETGLSVSTVSHHLKKLQETLGTDLLDHTRRPMRLTPSGAVFLKYIEEALQLIRRAEVELTSGNMAEVRELRMGIVDDFDSEIAPELAIALAGVMPDCTFQHHTRPSHEILGMLRRQKLDLGVATRPVNALPGLVEYPLLRDPYVLASPASVNVPAEDYLSEQSGLPFIRYNRDHLIGTQVEAQLRRLKIALPNRFEFESNQAILSMIAAGGGWTITTPASYMRAKRFHNRIRLQPFPGKGFARTLSFYMTEIYVRPVAENILSTLNRLIRLRMLEPLLAEMPWLNDSFYLMSPAEGGPDLQP